MTQQPRYAGVVQVMTNKNGSLGFIYVMVVKIFSIHFRNEYFMLLGPADNHSQSPKDHDPGFSCMKWLARNTCHVTYRKQKFLGQPNASFRKKFEWDLEYVSIFISRYIQETKQARVRLKTAVFTSSFSLARHRTNHETSKRPKLLNVNVKKINIQQMCKW